MYIRAEDKLVAQAKAERAAMVIAFFVRLFARKHGVLAQAH